jgi:hypothetical protein
MFDLGPGTGSNNLQRISGTMQTSSHANPQGKGEHAGRTPSTGTGQNNPQLMTANLPKGVTLSPGQALLGQVIAKNGNLLDIQFGRFTLSTNTNLPFAPGQRIQVMFTGQQEGNKVELQYIKSFDFVRISNNDLTQALTEMKIPVTDKSLNIARGMVEFGVPLTAKNVAEFTRVLSSLPRPATPVDMTAASFLKMSNLPLTPGNVMTLSNFIIQNPMIGAEIFEMARIPGMKGKSTKTKVDEKNQEVIEEIKNTLNRYIVEPKKQGKQEMMKNLKNLAREEGVEGIKHGFGGKNMEEGWELMRLLKKVQDTPFEQLTGIEKENMIKMRDMAGKIEQNLIAHTLINTGKPEVEMLPFYFLQIPVRLEEDETTAEVRVEFYEDGNGNKVVDSENTHIEFDVNTENLGEIHVDLRIIKGNVNMEIGTKKEGMEEFIQQFTPILKKNLDEIGYFTENIITGFYERMRKPLIEKEIFEKMEKVDVST